MHVELRGALRVILGSGTAEVAVPPEGLPLADVLARLASRDLRVQRVLDATGRRDVLRIVWNGSLIAATDNPLIHEEDNLLLLVAAAGG